jgi:hypothetical protein
MTKGFKKKYSKEANPENFGGSLQAIALCEHLIANNVDGKAIHKLRSLYIASIDLWYQVVDVPAHETFKRFILNDAHSYVGVNFPDWITDEFMAALKVSINKIDVKCEEGAHAA